MDEVDWSGVSEVRRKVKPLNAETFVERLRLLSARAHDLRVLRSAMPTNKKP